MLMKKYQSLHAYTTLSDGFYSHIELLSSARKCGIDTIAFTDHDSLLTSQITDTLRSVNDIRWISGIEISSGWPVELGGGPAPLLHVVGLFVDYTSTKLREYCRLAKEARVERMSQMVKNLNGIGIKITQDDCIQASKGEIVGRPHIVSALLSYKENHERIQEIRLDMQKVAENDERVNEQYEKIKHKSFDQHPYDLFLKKDSFIRNVYVDHLYYLDFDNSVHLIRDAGGFAILAHYFTCMNMITPSILNRFVKEKRIDGIEVVFGLPSIGTEEEQKVQSAMDVAQQTAQKHACLISGGADIHTQKDIDLLVEHPKYAEQTIGLLEEMMRNGTIDITFSNLSST